MPSSGGDLYGGAVYVQSAAANLTPQGRAIAKTSQAFGDGKTMCFAPCKRGYVPIHHKTGERMWLPQLAASATISVSREQKRNGRC
jgi:hypothetical protein